MTDKTRLQNPTQYGARFRHLKTGRMYRIIATGRIEATLTPCVVYEGEADGLVWVRPHDEFNDGRFEVVVPGDGRTPA